MWEKGAGDKKNKDTVFSSLKKYFTMQDFLYTVAEPGEVAKSTFSVTENIENPSRVLFKVLLTANLN